MSIPRVSIGLPVFNGENFLRRALDCLLRQDYPDFELIISDNSSTDGTAEICREYCAKDGRIRYYRNATNIGASGNFNRVFELARGEFFKWATHDDECHPSLVRRCLETFTSSPPTTVLVFPRAFVIDQSSQEVHLSTDTIAPANSSNRQPYLRLGSLIHHAWMAHPLWGVMRSEALRRTRMMRAVEADHVLLAELALLGEVVEIPEVLYWERRHPGNANVINRTARELAVWHDPSKANDWIILPNWLAWQFEYLGAVHHIRLAPVDRVMCYGAVLSAPVIRQFLYWTGPIRHRLGLHRKRSRLGRTEPAPRHDGPLDFPVSGEIPADSGSARPPLLGLADRSNP